MHHHGGVAEHGFRTGGGDHERTAAVGERVGDRPQLAVFFFADDFEVGDRGLQHRVPVHEALAAVDQTLLEQAHEGFDHGLGRHRVHREHGARPVAGRTEPAHLALDRVARFLLPLPDLFDEFLASERIARFALAFAREVAPDDHFRRDAGMVGTDLPERVVATHAVVADQRVHQGVLERMAHVQGAGHVRRRQHDGVGLAVAGRLEAAVLLPMAVPLGLEGGGFEALVHGAGLKDGTPGAGPGGENQKMA